MCFYDLFKNTKTLLNLNFIIFLLLTFYGHDMFFSFAIKKKQIVSFKIGYLFSTNNKCITLGGYFFLYLLILRSVFIFSNDHNTLFGIAEKFLKYRRVMLKESNPNTWHLDLKPFRFVRDIRQSVF